MDDPLYSVLLALAPFAVFFVALMIGVFARRQICPECGNPLPRFVSPAIKTRRQWLEGGTTCPDCGIDVDVTGRKVDGSSVTSPTRAIALFTALAGSVALAIILVFMVLRQDSLTPQGPVAPIAPPAPPQIAEPA